MINAIEVDTLKDTKEFSICTLVTNLQEYQEMLESFQNAGFHKDNSEFLYIDNSQENKYDAYEGLNYFLNKANGTYIILCHQDILLEFDDITVLRERIKEIDTLDKDWAILANAGYNDFNTISLRITDPREGERNLGQFPSKVESVDENFILVKNSANLTLSHSIGGFHLYGTDLAFLAKIIGYNTYVIDFHILHKSAGNADESFYTNKERFIQKYQQVLSWKMVRTPVTPLFISNITLLNKLCNKKLCYSLKKRWDKIIEFSKK
jgi:hypothetical protein